MSVNVNLNRVMDEIEKILDTILIHAGEQNCNHKVNDLIREIFWKKNNEVGFTRPEHQHEGVNNIIEGSKDPTNNE